MFKSYVISLAGSSRRSGIVTSFSEADLPFDFVDACDPAFVQALPASARDHYFTNEFYDQKAAQVRWGTLGCSLSHALLWERCERELPVEEAGVLIFEDDVRVDPCFTFNLARVLSDVGSDLGGYDIIFLPGWESDERYTTPQLATHRYVSRMVNFTLTAAAGYLIRRASLPKIIETVLPFGNEVDVYIAFLRDKLKIGLLPIWPHLLKAQVLPSERLGMDTKMKQQANTTKL
jgi:GR25 family glycosyltransferase involved in LPS biosynthesis